MTLARISLHCILKCIWKMLFTFFRKCYGLLGSDLAFSRCQHPWKYRSSVFFCPLSSFFIFLPQYLTNHNSKAYQPHYFPKELKKIFQEHLNKLLKLWLKFFCDQQKIQKMSHFWHLNDHNSGSKHDNQTNDSIFLIYSLNFIHWYVSFLHLKTFKIQFHEVPSLHYALVCKLQIYMPRWHFQVC